VTTVRVGNGFTNPLLATHAPGDPDRLFVVEKGTGTTGRVKTLDLSNGPVPGSVSTFLTVNNITTNNERGLLGLAFHPDFQNNGLFYLNLTDSLGRTNVVEYRVSDDPDLADPDPLRTLLTIDQPQANHNAGWMDFGPDGHLYIATGDGGGGNDSGAGHTPGVGNSQDITDNLLGKILRIDVNNDDFPDDNNRNYAIPDDNPFVGQTGDDEIWAYGLRNPFRNSFDRDTGDLWIADVGQNTREEVNFQPADSPGGENYGWRLREGRITTPTGGVGGSRPDGNVDPVYDYNHGFGTFEGRSVTGGFVYRGPIEQLQGFYFFGDFISSNLWTFDPADPFGTVENVGDQLDPAAGSINSISSFGEDLAGNLYIVDFNGGEVFRVVLPGDFDGDGDADAFDLGLWQIGFGTSSGAQIPDGDADFDGDVDAFDLAVWQLNFSGNGNSAAVPEPASAVLLLTTTAALACRRRTIARHAVPGDRSGR